MYICLVAYVFVVVVYVLCLSCLFYVAGRHKGSRGRPETFVCTPNLPTNIVPTHIARLKLSGKFPIGLIIPPL